MSLAKNALIFAAKAHEGQTRKYSGEPYIRHPIAVVKILQSVGITDDKVIAATYLHDVVEDCDVTNAEIEEKFGPEVAKMVWYLTDQPTSFGNRKARKADTMARLAGAPAKVKDIKVADLIDNSPSIKKHDPDFAKVFFREKTELLTVLKEANPKLLAQALEFFD